MRFSLPTGEARVAIIVNHYLDLSPANRQPLLPLNHGAFSYSRQLVCPYSPISNYQYRSTRVGISLDTAYSWAHPLPYYGRGQSPNGTTLPTDRDRTGVGPRATNHHLRLLVFPSRARALLSTQGNAASPGLPTRPLHALPPSDRAQSRPTPNDANVSKVQMANARALLIPHAPSSAVFEIRVVVSSFHSLSRRPDLWECVKNEKTITRISHTIMQIKRVCEITRVA